MWAPRSQDKVDSGLYRNQNTWVADVSSAGLSEMPGLRKDGQRAIRAKYPNGDPEQSGSFLRGANQGMGGGDYVKGWMPLAAHTEWVPPRRKPDAKEIVITADDWPSVEWPMTEEGGGTGATWTGEGDWGEYHLGMGGYCDDLDPPYGYWCAMAPPPSRDGGGRNGAWLGAERPGAAMCASSSATGLVIIEIESSSFACTPGYDGCTQAYT